MDSAMARWDGKTVVCIASGPSLTADDCQAIRAAGLPVIVTNNSWQLAPWADVLYAGDYAWWKRYRAEVRANSERWTCSERASREFDLHLHRAVGEYNTGARALQLACEFGAARILMLGYDMGPGPNGEAHWHGRHEHGLDERGLRVLVGNPDANRFNVWSRLFVRLAAELKGIEVLNCSRNTNLNCFPRAILEFVL